MPPFLRLLVPIVALALAAAGCGAASGDDPVTSASGPPGGSDGGLSVVATVYPLAWLAEQIAPAAAVTSLAASGQDPHSLELSPADREVLEGADVVLYPGDIGFQPQVENAIDTASGTIVSAAEVVGPDALLPLGHEHDAEDAHDDEAHGAVDPHVWFDATLMAEIARATGEALASADPEAGGAYAEAAAAVAAELESLADEIAGMLTDCTHDAVVVSHEAYAYLLEPHGLRQHGISGAGGHVEASPQRLAELTQFVRDEGLPAVLAEAAQGRANAEAVAAEAGVDLIEVSSLDIVTDEQAAAGYPALLREQADAVARAAHCGP